MVSFEHGTGRGWIYESFISLLTLEEISRAPEKIRVALSARIADSGLSVIDETVGSVELARAYVRESAIPSKYFDDARHLEIDQDPLPAKMLVNKPVQLACQVQRQREKSAAGD